MQRWRCSQEKMLSDRQVLEPRIHGKGIPNQKFDGVGDEVVCCRFDLAEMEHSHGLGRYQSR